VGKKKFKKKKFFSRSPAAGRGNGTPETVQYFTSFNSRALPASFYRFAGAAVSLFRARLQGFVGVETGVKIPSNDGSVALRALPCAFPLTLLS